MADPLAQWTKFAWREKALRGLLFGLWIIAGLAYLSQRSLRHLPYWRGGSVFVAMGIALYGSWPYGFAIALCLNKVGAHRVHFAVLIAILIASTGVLVAVYLTQPSMALDPSTMWTITGSQWLLYALSIEFLLERKSDVGFFS